MRVRLFVLAGPLMLVLAACSGGASPAEPTSIAVRTPTAAIESPTPAATVVQSPTPVATATPTAGPTETPTSEAHSPTAAPTAAPTLASGGGPASPTAVTQPPTATPTAASGAPMSATIGAAGTSRFVWSPSRVTIAAGGTVTWTWNEPVQPHNVAGDNFPLGPTGFEKADTVTFTFTSPGTYTFVCQTHPDTMRGTVTVQ